MRAATVFAVLAIATTAFAGANPDVTVYISFDQTGEPVHSVEAEPYTTIAAYVCVANIDGGVTSVTLALNDLMVDHPGVFAPPSFVPLYPFP